MTECQKAFREKYTEQALQELNSVVCRIDEVIDTLTTGMGKVLKDGDPKEDCPPDATTASPSCCEVARQIRKEIERLQNHRMALQELVDRLDA